MSSATYVGSPVKPSYEQSSLAKRDPEKLAQLNNPRVHASKQEIAKSLQGNWRPELLFVRGQEVKMYARDQERIAECDRPLQKQLADLSVANRLPARPTKRTKTKKPAKNAPRFDLGSELQRVTGVDFPRIDGIDVLTAQTLLKLETGNLKPLCYHRGFTLHFKEFLCARVSYRLQLSRS